MKLHSLYEDDYVNYDKLTELPIGTYQDYPHYTDATQSATPIVKNPKHRKFLRTNAQGEPQKYTDDNCTISDIDDGPIEHNKDEKQITD